MPPAVEPSVGVASVRAFSAPSTRCPASRVGAALPVDKPHACAAHALGKLPGRVGSFKEICGHVETDFADQLNWKLESDLRKTPVWKSSVRKILFSNSRFCPTPNDPNLFTFVAGAS